MVLTGLHSPHRGPRQTRSPPWRAPGGISAAPAQLSRPSVHRPASGSLAFLPKGVESSGLHHDLHAALEHVCSRWP